MAFHTFGPGLALDKITMRGLSTVTAQLIDAETGDPVQAYTMDDVPAETLVTTNRYGYFPQFKVPDTTRQLRMTFGGLTLENFAWELVLGAGQAADDAAAAWAAVEAIQNQVIAIDAPEGFDADSVTGQAIHTVNGLDNGINMPGEGSWTLLTYPKEGDGFALYQLALYYAVTDPQLWSRIKTSGGWSTWRRLDAGKWAERLDGIDAKDVEQDGRLDGIDSKDVEQDGRLTNSEAKDVEQDGRLTNSEAKDVEQDGRLEATEAKNTEQDDRLEATERQDTLQNDLLEPIRRGSDDTLNFTDLAGQVAAGVTPKGSFMIGETEHVASRAPHRIMDRAGGVAQEITPEGHTRIGNMLFRETAGGGLACTDLLGAIAWETTSSGVTHIYDLATGGGTTITELHPFLASGQSNMVGPGQEGTPAELDTPDPRILQFGANKRTIETAPVPLDMHGPALGLSPATVFAREYLKTQPAHVGVLLIPAAHGGTNFTDVPGKITWNHAAAEANAEPANDLWQKSVNQAIEAMAADTRCTPLKGILWHQGEGSSSDGFAGYGARMDTLIADYRAAFSDPSLPVLVGQMNPEGFNVGRAEIDQAHKAVPGRIQRTAFAPVIPDGGRYADTTHFSRMAVQALGRNYLDAYWRALVNTSAANPLRPQNVTAVLVGSTLTVKWDPPFCRVTAYRVEYDDGTGWTTATRSYPMDLQEVVTGVGSGPVRVRVTTLHTTTESAPSTPIYALGA